MSDSKIKVIYIAGETRSGSTLLSNILGEIKGFFNAGELIEIWDRGQVWPCSCGSEVANCEIWNPILKRVLEGRDQAAVSNIIHLRDLYAHTKKVPMALLVRGSDIKMKSRLKNYIEALSELYVTIQLVTKCRVIIDASKNAGLAYILNSVRSIDLYVLHLVRDARATAFSWSKKKEMLGTANPAKMSLRWALRNIVIEWLGAKLSGRYLRFHYEDFIQKPQDGIDRILALLDEHPPNPLILNDNEIMLNQTHGLCGNPDRFNTGIVKLRMDKRWKNMGRADKFIVDTLTWPLLRRYGYPLIPRF
jgi:hypothetical protein